ncbi:ribonuclease domain-containing protein [Kibdelosporangium aridum]|uniref:ribonuclease domain-containing protein n=1 Tax=Kibdelosporangium aridum TaxID=2030 RepID=UPI000A03FBC1
MARQGGNRERSGTYSGQGLPAESPRYYVETDILPTSPGGKRPESGRLVFGARGEVWYTGHYDDGFVQIRGPHCGC